MTGKIEQLVRLIKDESSDTPHLMKHNAHISRKLILKSIKMDNKMEAITKTEICKCFKDWQFQELLRHVHTGYGDIISCGGVA